MCAYQRLMMSHAAETPDCLREFCVKSGDLNMLWFLIAAIADFFNSHKVSQTPLMQLQRVYSPELMLSVPARPINASSGCWKGLIKEEDMNKSWWEFWQADLISWNGWRCTGTWSRIPVSVVNCDEHKKLAWIWPWNNDLLQNKNNSCLCLNQ